MQLKTKPQEVEVINAGQRLVRTNIISHYLPVDESKITQIEVPNMDGEGTHLETVYPELEVDYWTYDEKVEYSVCYVLLTPSDYLKLNEALSERMGFELGGATARLAPINPPLAIVGETILCVLMLDTEVLEKCADLLEGFELVDNFIPYSEPQELVATDLTQTQVDWTVSHAEETGVTVEVNESEVIVNPENNK